MKPSLRNLVVLLLGLAASSGIGVGQTLASGNDKTGAQLEALTKKIDEQNAKIDTLSQQILKLEKQIASVRPGVMIGGSSPAAVPSAAAPTASSTAAITNENAHVVAKGETLTSIAKAHKVGVQELQKFNHIENDRALQIGQTILLPPGATSPPPAATPTP